MGLLRMWICVLSMFIGLVSRARSSVVLEVGLQKYSYDGKEDCDNVFGLWKCDPYFKVCINTKEQSCKDNKVKTTSATNENELTDIINSKEIRPNPIYFKLGSMTEKPFVVRIDIMNDNPFHDHFIDRATWTYNGSATYNESEINLKGKHGKGSVTIYVVVKCDEGFYGPSCSIQCKSDSNIMCDSQGQKHCREGYTGDSCKESITTWSTLFNNTTKYQALKLSTIMNHRSSDHTTTTNQSSRPAHRTRMSTSTNKKTKITRPVVPKRQSSIQTSARSATATRRTQMSTTNASKVASKAYTPSTASTGQTTVSTTRTHPYASTRQNLVSTLHTRTTLSTGHSSLSTTSIRPIASTGQTPQSKPHTRTTSLNGQTSLSSKHSTAATSRGRRPVSTTHTRTTASTGKTQVSTMYTKTTASTGQTLASTMHPRSATSAGQTPVSTTHTRSTASTGQTNLSTTRARTKQTPAPTLRIRSIAPKGQTTVLTSHIRSTVSTGQTSLLSTNIPSSTSTMNVSSSTVGTLPVTSAGKTWSSTNKQPVTLSRQTTLSTTKYPLVTSSTSTLLSSTVTQPITSKANTTSSSNSPKLTIATSPATYKKITSMSTGNSFTSQTSSILSVTTQHQPLVSRSPTSIRFTTVPNSSARLNTGSTAKQNMSTNLNSESTKTKKVISRLTTLISKSSSSTRGNADKTTAKTPSPSFSVLTKSSIKPTDLITSTHVVTPKASKSAYLTSSVKANPYTNSTPDNYDRNNDQQTAIQSESKGWVVPVSASLATVMGIATVIVLVLVYFLKTRSRNVPYIEMLDNDTEAEVFRGGSLHLQLELHVDNDKPRTTTGSSYGT